MIIDAPPATLPPLATKPKGQGRSDAVTTEDDFNAALDAHPDDHHTRMVFADWLQERGDERAEGYRALGVGRRYPVSVRMAVPPWHGKRAWVFGGADNDPPEHQRHCLLSVDWLKFIERGKGCDEHWQWRRRLKRREAEDAAALAFAKLPAERRTELLAASPSDDKPPPKRPKKTARKKPTARKPKAKELKRKKK
jgi:uncharacterized protein (TIGR02996 family)